MPEIELELRDSWYDFFEFLTQGQKSGPSEDSSSQTFFHSPSTASSSLSSGTDEQALPATTEPSFSRVIASIVSTNDMVESSEEEEEIEDSVRKRSE